METSERPNLDDYPDSPYAAELRRSPVEGPFEPALETEYRKRHLVRMRLRVRVWFALGLGFEVFFGIDQLMSDAALSLGALAHLLVLGPGRIVLAVLVFSRLYESLFLRVAPVLVPLVYITMAVLNVQALIDGRVQQIGTFVLMVVGVFSFCGLYFRDAIRVGALMVIAYTVAGVILGLPSGMIFSVPLVLIITAIISGVAYKEAEISDRTSFLESGLIRELVSRDALTSLNNRRAFDEHLARAWKHALRNGRTISLLMIDVDYFKNFNDTYGHQAGDAALRALGQTLKTFARRPLDLAARYGGEEFAMIIYDLSPPYPQYLAEQIRSAIENLQIPHQSPNAGTFVTVSIGVAIVQPSVGRTAKGALQLADEALYKAKERGRNRSVVSDRNEFDTQATGSFGQWRTALDSRVQVPNPAQGD